MRWATIRQATLALFLLSFLLVAAVQLLYSRNWGVALPVVVYPIAATADRDVLTYIDTLKTSDFEIIDRWMAREAQRYKLPNPVPTQVRLGPTLDTLPPAYPELDGVAWLILWQLRMRLWAALNSPEAFWNWRTVRIYLVLHGANRPKYLPHSIGMQKGLIGLVHGFAEPRQTSQNIVVVAHELLHTVGATDKYNQYGDPIFPHGYANPTRKPLYPQRSAEIMAGRIPTSEYRSVMAHSLRSSRIGPHTAREINWIE
ncbi:MAG: hypothetical protein AAF460_08465 [Pseudomonadota bacterium]